MATSRIEDFYPTGEEFETVCRAAIRETDSDSGLDFLIQVNEKWEKFGMRALWSEKQDQYLRGLAGID